MSTDDDEEDGYTTDGMMNGRDKCKFFSFFEKFAILSNAENPC